jgi:hypothetical protein
MATKFSALTFLALAFFVAGRALSVPQGSQQRACIDALNGNSAKVGKTQAKAIVKCVRAGANGDLGALPLVGELETCFLADAGNRVFTASGKGLAREQAKCLANFLPTFAVPDIGANPYNISTNNYSSVVNPGAVKAQMAVMRDMFGFPADGALVDADSDSDGASCQYNLLRAAMKCSEGKAKTFNKCAKNGLRDAVIAGPADLETQCLTEAGNPATGQPDPGGRLLKRCEQKFASVIAGRCSGVNLNAAFPGRCTAANLANCLGDRVNCRVCQQLNLNNDLNRDCDLFDDGTDNDSCPNVLPNCGDGIHDSPAEDCDDGNTVDGDCCSSTCTFEASGSACGNSTDNACTNPDTCNGAGACQANHESAGVSCGDPSDTDCTDPDTCDGSGACIVNHLSTGSACGDSSDTECTDPDTCGASGTCLDNHAASGSACGDPADNACTDPDTCDGSGACEDNHASSGAACGDASDTECTDPDTCDGSGMCQSNHAAGGAACGSPSNTDCTNPDTCDGSGSCQVNDESAGTICTSDGNTCTSDQCDAGGVCQHANLPNGSSCGDTMLTDCSNPDTCSAGVCQPNHDPSGAPCISDGNDCTDDLCSGSGTCTHPNKTAGTACGDDGAECTNDICNGGGTCTHPPKTLGVPCTSDGNPCTNDQCNGAGACSHPNNTAPCNDNIFCNGADTCSAGACTVHAGNPCSGPDSDTNCSESCNESADNCLAQDPNGSFCSDGMGCNGVDSCQGGVCTPTGVCCGTVDFTFTVNSNNGGAFDGADWPGGTASQTSSPGCGATINRPNNQIDLVCTLAAPFSINSFTGFQNCFGHMGEDGDGCWVDSCPFAGIGSCCSTRPSCSVATNGSASARYFVRCVDP